MNRTNFNSKPTWVGFSSPLNLIGKTVKSWKNLAILVYTVELFLINSKRSKIFWNKVSPVNFLPFRFFNSSNVPNQLKKSFISKFITVLYLYSTVLHEISLDPYIHYGHTEISSGSKFWYAILIILLIICSTILVWRFWCRRHDKVSGPAVEFMVNDLSKIQKKNLENLKSKSVENFFLGIPELLQMEEPTRRVYSYLNHCSKKFSAQFLNWTSK